MAGIEASCKTCPHCGSSLERSLRTSTQPVQANPYPNVDPDAFKSPTFNNHDVESGLEVVELVTDISSVPRPTLPARAHSDESVPRSSGLAPARNGSVFSTFKTRLSKVRSDVVQSKHRLYGTLSPSASYPSPRSWNISERSTSRKCAMLGRGSDLDAPVWEEGQRVRDAILRSSTVEAGNPNVPIYQVFTIRKAQVENLNHNKASWSKAEIIKHCSPDLEVSKQIRALSTGRSVAEKAATLSPSQRGQIKKLLVDLESKHHDSNCQWTLCQLVQKEKSLLGGRDQESITVFFEQAPRTPVATQYSNRQTAQGSSQIVHLPASPVELPSISEVIRRLDTGPSNIRYHREYDESDEFSESFVSRVNSVQGFRVKGLSILPQPLLRRHHHVRHQRQSSSASDDTHVSISPSSQRPGYYQHPIAGSYSTTAIPQYAMLEDTKSQPETMTRTRAAIDNADLEVDFPEIRPLFSGHGDCLPPYERLERLSL